MIDRDVILAVCLIGGVGSVLYFVERCRFSTKELSLIAAVSALAALGRIPFAAIPNAQPTTFLIIISGAVFGSTAGFAVGVSSALVSNMFLGHGPWTLFQMIAWGLCGASSGLLVKWRPGTGTRALVIFGFLWGYLYGWIMNLWYWIGFVYPLSMKSWLAVNAASFWFDTIHAVTNAVFVAVIGLDCVKILKRFKEKLSFTYVC